MQASIFRKFITVLFTATFVCTLCIYETGSLERFPSCSVTWTEAFAKPEPEPLLSKKPTIVGPPKTRQERFNDRVADFGRGMLDTAAVFQGFWQMLSEIELCPEEARFIGLNLCLETDAR